MRIGVKKEQQAVADLQELSDIYDLSLSQHSTAHKSPSKPNNHQKHHFQDSWVIEGSETPKNNRSKDKLRPYTRNSKEKKINIRILRNSIDWA